MGDVVTLQNLLGKDGDTHRVVDLGLGVGHRCVFLAANAVGQLKGKVVKIDKTGKILYKARGSAEAHGYTKCRAQTS
jgi:hypothetical protein